MTDTNFILILPDGSEDKRVIKEKANHVMREAEKLYGERWAILKKRGYLYKPYNPKINTETAKVIKIGNRYLYGINQKFHCLTSWSIWGAHFYKSDQVLEADTSFLTIKKKPFTIVTVTITIHES